ncbi:MAG: Wzz/FepE/Etk N-terminal domain-containing protein, partial [Pseudomonadota bacterium]
MADTADWGPSGIVQADGGYQPARPRLTFVDLVLQLWRAKWLMILVGLPIFALGLLAALQMPKTFESNSRLYVRAGDEIRIGSIVTDPSREALPELEQIIQGELELLRSPVVAERTLSRFPLQRIYPKLQQGLEKELASSPPRDAEAIEFEVFRESVEAFEKNVFAGAAPKTPVISVSFRHKDPEVAAEVLNATIASYLNYRAELFGARSTNKLTVQRRKAEADLLAAEQAIRTFLRNNGIGDFNNERGTAQGLFSTIRGELFGVNSRASAVDGQLTRTRTQLRNIEPEINLFIEDSSDQTLLDLQVQREELLSRYREDSR